MNNKEVIHTIQVLNTNGSPFVTVDKVGKNSFYVNEYEDRDFGRWMDLFELGGYINEKFASKWRANLITGVLNHGKDFEHKGEVADCFKVVG